MENEVYIKQKMDPNMGFPTEYSTVYYTSNEKIEWQSREGIGIWYSKNDNKIKIVKINDVLYKSLLWYDDKKEIILRKYLSSFSGGLTNKCKEKKANKEEIEYFIDQVRKIKDTEVLVLLCKIFDKPDDDYYILNSMLE